MCLNRFFINFDGNKKMITVDDNVFFNQAKNVLRFEAGDKLILCDSEKNEAMTQIISYSKNSVNLEILEIRK